MILTEIMLIIIGVIAFAASFFVTERLSQRDLEQITLMSEADLKLITEKQLKSVKRQMEDSLEEIVEESLETTKRGLEKETNKKIMAVSEYSDTVIEEINKVHNEIVFLYSMLKDKQSEAADMVRDLQRVTKQVREMDLEHRVPLQGSLQEKSMESVESIEKNPVESAAEIKEDVQEEQLLSKTDQILLLHKEGKDELEIAKALDCGLGVVRLVLGLYHET